MNNRINVSREFGSEIQQALALLKPVHTILKTGRAGARFYALMPGILVRVRRLLERTIGRLTERGWGHGAEAQVIRTLGEAVRDLNEALRMAEARGKKFYILVCLRSLGSAVEKLTTTGLLLEEMALVSEAGWLGVSARTLNGAGVDLKRWKERRAGC